MKPVRVLPFAACLLLAGACTSEVVTSDEANATDSEDTVPAPYMGTGNGAPNGPHYNLNIIGVPKGKTMSNGSGNVIFVPETGSTKIMLSEGPFDVLDKNGRLEVGVNQHSLRGQINEQNRGRVLTARCLVELDRADRITQDEFVAHRDEF